jgi:hypothetical protein
MGRKVPRTWAIQKYTKLVGARCAWCGVTTSKPKKNNGHIEHLRTHDHLIPYSQGGHHVLDNIVIACSACNGERGCLTPTRFWQQKAADLTVEQMLRVGDHWKAREAFLGSPQYLAWRKRREQREAKKQRAYAARKLLGYVK